MPTFAPMTRLALAEVKNLSVRAKRRRRWMARVHAWCPGVERIADYTMPGPYDFLDISGAPGEAVAARASLIALAFGTSAAESWTLIPCDRYLTLTRSL